jgi:hypothetical protein
VSTPTPVVEALRAAAGAFERIGCAWYVFGAQAVTVWGIPRMSADLDLTAQLEPDQVSRFVRELEASGFTLRVQDPEVFVERTRVLPLVHASSGLLVDVVLSGPGIEEEFHRRAIALDLAGAQVPFISPEDLIVTKILAGRPKDIDDVHGVLRTRGSTLDLELVRHTLALLESALGQSDLLPTLASAVARAGITGSSRD